MIMENRSDSVAANVLLCTRNSNTEIPSNNHRVLGIYMINYCIRRSVNLANQPNTEIILPPPPIFFPFVPIPPSPTQVNCLFSCRYLLSRE